MNPSAEVTNSNLPFVEAFSAVRGDCSFRDLERRTRDCDPSGNGLSRTYLNHMARGLTRPTAPAMRLIAEALGIEPEYFAEYRLAAARWQLDERRVGLDAALQALAESRP